MRQERDVFVASGWTRNPTGGNLPPVDFSIIKKREYGTMPTLVLVLCNVIS